MNGDCFCVIDYNQFIAFHQKHHAKASLAVTLMPDARDYGTSKSPPITLLKHLKKNSQSSRRHLLIPDVLF